MSGKLANRVTQQRQQAPGDWDAWVSQGPIANHAREHLASTDRGITLYRRIIRRGIRQVAAGQQPDGVDMGRANPVFSHCHNTVMHVGEPGNDDQALMVAFGREVTRRVMAGVYSKNPAGSADPCGLNAIREALVAGRN